MVRKSIPEKASPRRQPETPAKNEGLVAQIVEEFLKRLRESTLVEAGVTKSLEELTLKGKLKDLDAVQAALRTPPKTNDNATS